MDTLIFKEIKNYRKVVKNIREDLTRYIISNDIKSLVLGVSGGLDSAVVAALVRPVCDKLGVRLLGISLPSATNEPDEVHRADSMKGFCNWYHTLPIDDMFNGLWKRLEFGEKIGENRKPVARGNIKARIRMIILYNYAFTEKGMVLGTDNLTEYLLGFWTLHGDVGDFSPVQFLWKTEIYKLAQYIIDSTDELRLDQATALENCISAVPTDGLGITSSDMVAIAGSSSITYDQIDRALMDALRGKVHNGLADRVLDRYNRTTYKRNNPYNISRERLLGGR